MLETIKQQLKNFPIASVCPESGNSGSTAAVLLILHGEPDNPSLLLTERAQNLNSHAGEVAFPGGMWEVGDRDLLGTALRETEEEIGLLSDQIKPLAMLPNASPRNRNMVVTPFVAWAESPLRLSLGPSEIASVFDLPLNVAKEKDRYQYFDLVKGAVQLPYLEYQGYKIWGFTLKVMVDMLNLTVGAQIKLRYPSQQQFAELGYKG